LQKVMMMLQVMLVSNPY